MSPSARLQLLQKYTPSRFPYVAYTAAEHETWRTLLARYKALIPHYMCEEYLEAFERMRFPTDRIPGLDEVEEQLMKFSDWRLARVHGLIPNDDFYGLFAERIFATNDFIRDGQDIDYTPSPDIFHEVIGHLPMLTNKHMADFTQEIGEFALEVTAKYGADKLVPLSRIYWFTLEFGLINTHDGLRIYGAGFAPGEMKHCMTDQVQKRAFDAEAAAMTPFNFWQMQDQLFVVDSLEEVVVGFRHWMKHFDPTKDYGRNPKKSEVLAAQKILAGAY